MTSITEAQQSSPELLLFGQGDARSYDILQEVLQSLSDEELAALEDDISFYTQTRLVGIYMSRLLLRLKVATSNEAEDGRDRASDTSKIVARNTLPSNTDGPARMEVAA